MHKLKKNNAAILILALWAMGFLTVLVVQIGFGSRQKITLLQRLEERAQLQSIAEAGVKKTTAYIAKELQKASYGYDGRSKQIRHNNPDIFKATPLGGGQFTVFYQDWNEMTRGIQRRPGVMDEERKLNVNIVDQETLKRLFQLVLDMHQDEARDMAQAFVDWREVGEGSAEGFYSDSYYANLKEPYPMKNDFFELPSELLLIKGMTQERYDQLLPFLTVYGDGLININTVSKPVLMALGLDEGVANKIMAVRRGPDAVEGTNDDHIFERTYDIAAEVQRHYKLKPNEIAQIDYLNIQSLLATTSFFYSFVSLAEMPETGAQRRVFCVFDLTTNGIKYWHEK